MKRGQSLRRDLRNIYKGLECLISCIILPRLRKLKYLLEITPGIKNLNPCLSILLTYLWFETQELTFPKKSFFVSRLKKGKRNGSDPKISKQSLVVLQQTPVLTLSLITYLEIHQSLRMLITSVQNPRRDG